MAGFSFLGYVSESNMTLRLSEGSPNMPECLVPESLTDLERERAKLLQQFLSLGDFRPGSITASVRPCGKPTCHCAKPNDPGHEAQLRMSRKVNGKTINESFPTLAALHKAQREVAEFQRFQQLGQQLVEINQKICALRPMEAEGSGWTPQEKKRLLRSIRKLRRK
jgi:hypothetical protein